MKVRLSGAVFAVLLVVTAEAQQSAFPAVTNALSTDTITHFQEISAKAQKGDAQAQYNLGICYQYGEGVTQDYSEAVKWHKKAAEQGDANAQYAVGVSYLKGRGVAQDYAEAVKWFRKAADQGHTAAQCDVGAAYGDGKGVTQDYAEAVRWYSKAAQQGVAGAQFNLGLCYFHGNGVAQDYAEAVKWYRKAAEQGDADSQCNLGSCYVNGEGVTKDYVQAYKWNKLASAQGDGIAKQFLPDLQRQMTPAQIAEGERLASEFKPTNTRLLARLEALMATNDDQGNAELRAKAEKGDADAQFSLGYSYHIGRGVAQDFSEAMKWLRKAADSGNADAQLELGRMFYNGDGATKDYAEAVKWFHEAADQGNPVAQLNLGICYDQGEGVAQDNAEAVNWYRKAADQGNSVAQFNLGISYDQGEGITQDFGKAGKWFRKAAEQGYAGAEYELGFMYDSGRGVPQDYVEAYKWYNLAAAQDDTNAIHNRSNVSDLMTQAQIAEGQRLSREFKPSRADVASSLPGAASADASPTSSGTGFFITEDGFLVTAAHVVNGATEIRLATRAGLVTARLLKLDPANDLALLKAEGQFSALPVVSSRAAKLGSTVATIGFPNTGLQGFAPKLAKGEIASLTGPLDDPRYFQISLPVQPGNSGGALVDDRGNVVGVVSAKLDAAAALAASGALPENVNYAIKSSFLLSFLESVPEVAAKLKEPGTKEKQFEDVVKSAEQAAAIVLIY